MSTLLAFEPTVDDPIIAEICDFNWSDLSQADMTAVAWAYYYFSIQFRQNLQLACEYFADDENLAKLRDDECATENLSPYPGIAEPGERLNHDTFMHRAVRLSPVSNADLQRFEIAGARYARQIMHMHPKARALSIASYKRGGLERLFRAILTAPNYDDASLHAFRHFMETHIGFDSNPIEGHAALSRQITPDEGVIPLWVAFRQLLLECTPGLAIQSALPQQAQPMVASL